MKKIVRIMISTIIILKIFIVIGYAEEVGVTILENGEKIVCKEASSLIREDPMCFVMSLDKIVEKVKDPKFIEWCPALADEADCEYGKEVFKGRYKKVYLAIIKEKFDHCYFHIEGEYEKECDIRIEGEEYQLIIDGKNIINENISEGLETKLSLGGGVFGTFLKFRMEKVKEGYKLLKVEILG